GREMGNGGLGHGEPGSPAKRGNKGEQKGFGVHPDSHGVIFLFPQVCSCYVPGFALHICHAHFA
ncbi:MAG: hypothetical protein Q7T14_08755, partial [Aestuariivirga sp.]|nr:hypothetical protein [Aestuariivirga sp.]